MTVVVALLLVPAWPADAHPGPGPGTYAWVRPPTGGTPTVPPAQGRAVVLDDTLLGQGRADVWTPDAQALVTVEGSAPLDVALTPLDPAELPGLPDLQASGNAYEVTLDGDVARAVTVLRPPHPVTVVARLDGARWDVTSVVPGPDGEVRVPWEGPGPYVAAAPRLDGHATALGAFVHDPFRVGLFLVGVLGLVLGRGRWVRRGSAAVTGEPRTGR